MNNPVIGQTVTGLPLVRFTPAHLKVIYAVFVDRYEELDAYLRSSPPERRIKEAIVEKECVESVIRQICNAGSVPKDHESVQLALPSSNLPAYIPARHPD